MNRNLTARFLAKKYKITWKLNKGKKPKKIKKLFAKNFQYAKGINKKTLKKIKPIRKGYKFVGWFSKKNLKGKKIASIGKTRGKKITLYAKWKRA